MNLIYINNIFISRTNAKKLFKNYYIKIINYIDEAIIIDNTIQICNK
jgi:hypothetical protein